MIRNFYKISSFWYFLFISLLVVISFLQMTICGCGSGVTGGGAPVPTGIGPAGGWVYHLPFKMYVPPGAVTKETYFIVEPYYTSSHSIVTGSAYSVKPLDLIFLVPAIINIGYNSATPTAEEQGYYLGSFNDGTWYGISGSTVETSLDYVTGETSSLGIFAIATPETQAIVSLEIIEITSATTQLADIGYTYQLVAVSYPSVTLEYEWSTTIPSIVSVSSYGTIEAVTLGIATVNAYAVGKKSSPCTVISGDFNVNSIVVTPETGNILENETKQFYGTAKNIYERTIPPQYASLSWFSTNGSVASINSSGIATGQGEGSCEIYATSGGKESNHATLEVIGLPDWTITTVDASSFHSCYYTSIALDSSNKAKIGYYRDNGYDLMYASYESSWNTEMVDGSGSSNDVGNYCSLALDNNGSPRISYYDAVNGNLKYASWEGSGWYITTVDASAGDVGLYTSIALDSYGNPRISYYDSSNGNLKYASWEGSGWNIQVVQSSGVVGLYTSLKLDSSGNPRISYYDDTNGNLMYVSHNGSSWLTPVAVDSIGVVGLYTSLALDGIGNPRISYYNSTNNDLKYAWYDGSWHDTVVDSSGKVGRHSSLALNSLGSPRISYWDEDNNILKFAWYEGSNWYTMTIDSTEIGGEHTSLAIGTDNNAKISYRQYTDGHLKYAEQQ